MARRLLSSRAHADLFEVPTDPDALIRHYLLSGDDIDLIRTRRRAENLLGVAVHICLLRYPGFGWSDGIMPPAELIAWLAEQLQVDACTLDDYAFRPASSTMPSCLPTRRPSGGTTSSYPAISIGIPVSQTAKSRAP